LAVAQITGISGQDDLCLMESLLNSDYEVRSIKKRTSSRNPNRVSHLRHIAPAVGGRIALRRHFGEFTEAGSGQRLMRTFKPTETYSRPAQTHVGSFSYQLDDGVEGGS